MEPKVGSPVEYHKGGKTKRGFIERLTDDGAFVTQESDMAYNVNKKDMKVLAKRIDAASVPQWFSQFVPVLSAMAAKRPLVQPGHSSSSITVRFPTDKAYVDATLLRKLFNLCARHKLGMYFEKRVNGLYLTITDEEVAEAETGVSV